MANEDSRLSRPFELMDGAEGEFTDIQKDVNRQREITGDLSRPLAERLEACEDIIDSEVGDTAFIRARNIERETGLRQIFLKFEGGNPTGTQKDRIAFHQAMDALRRQFDTITVATCGNFGVAQALAGLSFRKNLIVQAFLKNKPTCEDLTPQHIKETRVNEPLINWHAIDGNLALKAIRETNGWAGDATDKAMRQYSRLIREARVWMCCPPPQPTLSH